MRRLNSSGLIGLGGLRPADATAAAVSIEVSRGPSEARFAPEGMTFRADLSGFDSTASADAIGYDAAMHDAVIEWDFGDAGATFTAPTRPPAGHSFRDANKGYGRYAAHVFRAAGTYTVTCTARQIVQLTPFAVVKQAVATLDVTVAEPAWDGMNTVVISRQAAIDNPDDPTQWPGWADAPPHYQKAWIHLDTSLGYNYQHQAEGNMVGPLQHWEANEFGAVRFLFHADEEFDFGLDRDIFRRGMRLGTGWPKRVDYGTWGAGAKPVIREPAAGFYEMLPYHHFGDIEIAGYYDPVTQSYTDSAATGDEGTLTLNNNRFGEWRVVDNVDFRNNRISVNAGFSEERLDGNGDVIVEKTIINNCTQTDSGDYFAFYSGLGCLALLGNDASANPASLANGQGRNTDAQNRPSTNDHCCLLRTSATATFVIDGNSSFSNFGWTGDFPAWPDGVGRTASQPHIRLSRDVASQQRVGPYLADGRIAKLQITRNTFDGDAAVLTTSGYGNQEDGTGYAHLSNVVFAMNVMATAYKAGFLQIFAGNTSIWGNVGVVMGLPGHADDGTFAPVTVQWSGPFQDLTIDQANEQPIRVYGNTWVYYPDTEGTPFIAEGVDIDPDRTTVVASDNVIYAPNLGADMGQVDPALLGTVDSTEFFASSWNGPNEQTQPGASHATQQTQWAAPPGAVSLYRPASAPAISGAWVSLLDVNGDDRGLPGTAGATVPAI